MNRLSSLLPAVACLLMAAALPGAGLDLVYLGRDAIFVEQASLARQGNAATFRMLRVQDSQFKAGQTSFLGGWAKAELDCRSRMFRLTSFQSLKPDLGAGPETAIRGEAFPIASGSAEEAMAKAVCDGKPMFQVHAATVQEAVEIGRKRLDTLD